VITKAQADACANSDNIMDTNLFKKFLAELYFLLCEKWLHPKPKQAFILSSSFLQSRINIIFKMA
jgi:hypothetical protein